MSTSLCFGVFVFFDILWQANKKSELVKKKNDVVLQLPQNNDEKKMSNTSKPRCLFDSLICSKFSENGAIMGKLLVQKGTVL